MNDVIRRLRGTVGLAVIGTAYVVLASGLVQYLLANNARRRMDVAISGGAAGIGLLVVGGVILLAERAVAYADARDRDDATFLDRLTTIGAAAGGPALVALPDVVLASEHSYHRPGCLLVEGRAADLAEISLPDAIASGRSACRLCLKGLV